MPDLCEIPPRIGAERVGGSRAGLLRSQGHARFIPPRFHHFDRRIERKTALALPCADFDIDAVAGRRAQEAFHDLRRRASTTPSMLLIHSGCRLLSCRSFRSNDLFSEGDDLAGNIM